MAKNYFCRLFQSNSQIIDNQDLDYIQECINKETNDWLIMDDSKSEVVQTIKHMDPCKAPGIDGLSGSFFKYNWETVGNNTIQFYLDILNGKQDISCLNDTVIILIPEIRDPDEITNFRPISLCKYTYKIIPEVLANRLKVALLGCISQNQSDFFPWENDT
ncbi:hypothetical protein GOBAR_AA39923 [Gossypium barbadense]|uniref:Reverse transcriptase domain-containing protein n=1 Tax=Gossypium barbadense TaxID=3634 RepID=A0A2P5VPU3_GOSBA|nr:hypothetical protein GOBAR_AA39923 [Gossypium barbadense]